MGWLTSFFWTPDSFERDPKGFARNQIEHIALAFVAVLLGAPLAAVLVLSVTWEVAQWIWASARPHDTLEDVFFFWAGAFLASGYSTPVAVLTALALASGVARRLRDGAAE